MCACRKRLANFSGPKLGLRRAPSGAGFGRTELKCELEHLKRVRTLETRGRGASPTLSLGRALLAGHHYCGFECS